jgi:hypothetical protein
MSRLSSERRERAPFQHAQVPRKILPMHSSALNGARNKRMAQVQHDTEIQLPRSTPSRHSMEKNLAPQSKVRSTARKNLLRHRFRHKVFPVYTQDDRPCILSFHGAAFEVIPAGVFQRKTTSGGPWNTSQAAMFSFDSGHGRKILIPGRKGERRCFAYLEHSAGRALLHSLLAVTVQCYGHGNSQIE